MLERTLNSVAIPNLLIAGIAAAVLLAPGGCTEVIPVYDPDGGINGFTTGDPTGGLDAAGDAQDAVAPPVDTIAKDVPAADDAGEGPELAPIEDIAVTEDVEPEAAIEDTAPEVIAPVEETAETEDVPPEVAQEDVADEVDDGPVDCCDGVTCAPFHECSLLSCGCEALYDDPCVNEGDNCDPQFPQPNPWMCVQYGPLVENGVCRTGCIATGGVADDPCPDGFLCGSLPGEEGWCLPQTCTGFFLNDCGPDATCLPLLAGDGACVPDGEGFYGSPCNLHNECAHNMLCIDGICSAPDCTPFSQTEPCLPGVQCMPLAVGVSELDAGFCATPCNVFLPDECPEGQWCYPLLNEPEAGDIDGHCIIANGPAGLGDDCSLNANICAQGLTCVADPQQQLACEQLCDPTATAEADPGACPPGRGCVPLLITDDSALLVEVMDFGSCVPGCTPWLPAAESGCAAEQWCQPAMFNPAAGECNGTIGGLEEAAPCTNEDFDTTCQDGLMCLGINNMGVLNGFCVKLCDPTGGPGDTCAAEQLCDVLEFVGSGGEKFSLGIGICQPPPE